MDRNCGGAVGERRSGYGLVQVAEQVKASDQVKAYRLECVSADSLKK